LALRSNTLVEHFEQIELNNLFDKSSHKVASKISPKFFFLVTKTFYVDLGFHVTIATKHTTTTKNSQKQQNA
jgi:hypothetical protein